MRRTTKSFLLSFMLLLAPLTATAAQEIEADKATVRVVLNISNTPEVDYFFTPYFEGLKMGFADESPEARVIYDYQNNLYDKAKAQQQFAVQRSQGYDLAVSGSGTTSRLIAPMVEADAKPHLMIAFEPDIIAEGPGRIRVLPSYASEAAVIEQVVRQMGARTVGALHVHTDGFDQQYMRHFSVDFARAGVNLVDRGFDWNEKNFESLVDDLMREKPDAIIISAYHSPQLPPILAALKDRVPSSVPVILSVHAVDLPAANLASIANHRFVCPTFITRSDDPVVSAWRQRWQKTHQTEPFYTAAYGYDAGRLLGKALKMGKISPASIRSVKSFPGLSGAVALDETGDLKGTLSVCKLNDRLEPVLDSSFPINQ